MTADTKTRKVPKLRFPGFNGEWEEEMLPNIADFQEGPGILAKDFHDDGVPLIRLSGLSGQSVTLEGCNYLDPSKVDEKWSHFRLKTGDMLVTTSGTLGNVSEVDSDTVGSVAYTGIIRFRPTNISEKKYLKQLLTSPVFQRQAKIMSTGAVLHHFGPTHLKRMKFALPTKDEQEKIAGFLSTVDDKVSAIDKKVELLKKYKKGIMQKIFPSTSSVQTPEIRFKDDNGKPLPAWQEKKLGGVMEIGSSKRVLQKDWQQSGVPFYRTREIINLAQGKPFRTPIFISENLYDELSKKYGTPKPGDMLVTGVGSIGSAYLVDNDDKFYFKDGNVLWFRKSEKLDPKFLFQALQTRFIQKQMADNASITTVATYTIDGAKNTKVKMPVLEEQQKIADFLKSLDAKIELEEKKLEQAKKFKKSLLQQMFI
ncbi:MAG: restriction endonuclease subunit S [Candidatus Saccharibacteria bacterium]|nr:restriction endonuclease subunit S [Candidatus Saccharibacteria bacterium]